MSENSVNGIVVDKISLNAMNVAFMRKLNNFDCAIVLDQQGNDKNGKAQLAVLDTVAKTPKPSILLITTERLLYAWYQTMLCGIGADFKFITADPKSINYFSPKISNFYITHCGAAENPIFEKIKQSGLVWDLVIIDGGLASDGIDTDRILKAFDFKTKKLAVFAPYIRSASGEAEKLSQLPEKFLADSSKADYFHSNTPGLSATAFSLSNPFMQCFTAYDTKIPDVKIINYTLNDEVLKAKQEQSALSLYTYGGNIFEDLMQALYGRNGESPLCVLAAASPTDCFTMAFEAARIAIEHMTPVILLTDAFIANGSSAWRVPEEKDFPEIHPHYVDADRLQQGWKPFDRDENQVRYWAIPGTPGAMHRVGGLEKDIKTSAISTDGKNHERMVNIRREKIARIADDIPELTVSGNPDADTILVGWGGTYGHLYTAAEELNAEGHDVAFAQFRYINPLPKNALDVLKGYKRIIVAELNTGMFADYLQMHLPGKTVERINKVEGQPFMVREIVDGVKRLLAGEEGTINESKED